MTTGSAHALRAFEPVHLDADVNVEGLFAELRRAGFDLRRSVFISYLVETGTHRDAAYAVRDRAAGDGWTVSLYGDCSGWVVRMLRVARCTPELILRDHAYVNRLARSHSGQLRGFTIEDPYRDDEWQQLAARITDAQARPPAGATLRRNSPITRWEPIPRPRSA